MSIDPIELLSKTSYFSLDCCFLICKLRIQYLGKFLVIAFDFVQFPQVNTREELLQSCQVYREIYETQFRKEAANR